MVPNTMMPHVLIIVSRGNTCGHVWIGTYEKITHSCGLEDGAKQTMRKSRTAVRIPGGTVARPASATPQFNGIDGPDAERLLAAVWGVIAAALWAPRPAAYRRRAGAPQPRAMADIWALPAPPG